MPERNMKSCKYCGGLVANNAKACPHCGGKLKTSGCGCGCLIILVVLIIAVIGMVFLFAEATRNNPNLSGDELTMTEKQYKKACNAIEYDTLARRADSKIGDKIRIYGQVFIDFGDDATGSSQYEISTIGDQWGIYCDGCIRVYYTNTTGKKLLEKDMVTVYGEVGGIDEYGMPVVHAAYIDLE